MIVLADMAHKADSNHRLQAVAQKRKLAPGHLDIMLDHVLTVVSTHCSLFTNDFVRRGIEAILEYNVGENPATGLSYS